MFGHRGVAARCAVLLLLVVFLAVGWVSFATPRAFAEGTYLQMPGVNDVCYDNSRGLIYYLHGCAIERYDVAAKKYLPWFRVGTPESGAAQAGLVGIDISPDGKTIAVADLYNYIDGVDDGATNHIWLVDAETGANHYLKFPQVGAGREGGTWTVQYGFDGKLLVTTAANGAGWTPLRVVDPVTGVVTSPVSLIQNFSDLAASGDRGVITFAEKTAVDGRWGTYRVSDGTVNHRTGALGTAASNYAAATNTDGSQSAVLANTTAYIYEANGARRTVSGVLGAKYSPTADVLYMPQAYGTAINAFDTHTLSVLKTYDFEQAFTTNLGGSRGTPRLAVARDNSVLASLTQGGLRFTRMRPAVVGTVHSTYHGLPVPNATVEIWRQKAGAWSIEGTTGANEWGSWTYTTDDTSTPIRARVTDPSGINSAQWVGGTDLTSATGLTPARLSAPSADVTLTVSAPAGITGTVRSSFKNRPLAGAQVVLYAELENLAPTASTRGVLDNVSSIATTTADESGSYAFSGLGVARYRVGFSDPASDNLSAYYASAATLGSATAVAITSSATQTVDQTLVFVGYNVRGTVTSSFRGVPVSGATLEFWRDNGHGYALDSTVTAAADGAWHYVTDTTATVRVKAIDPSGAADPTWFGGSTLESATAVSPVRDGTPTVVPVVMALAHPGAIEGVVRSSSHGQVLSGIQVELHQDIAGYPTIATTQTAADGSYSFGALGVTGYRLGFSDLTAAHTTVFWNGQASVGTADVARVTGPTSSTVDATMTFVPTYVGGRVVSSFVDKPIAGAQVELWRKHGATWTRDQTATADSAGSWSASFETSDAVRVHITDPANAHDALWYGGTSVSDAKNVMPARRAPALFNARMVLTHGTTIVGTLRSSWKSEPIVGAVASLYYDDGTGLHSIATTRTTANGSYLFDGIAPATVYISFTDQTGAHLPNAYATTPLVATIDGLLVNDVTLERIPSVVAGGVFSSFDNPDADNPNPPIPGARIEIYREGVSGWAREATLTADVEGAWSYATPDPAPVRVHIVDPSGMHDPAWYDGASSLQTAADVLPVAKTLEIPATDVVLDLARPASFHGTVRDAVTGARLPGIGVALVSATAELPLVAWADALADGTYSITGIPAGSYYLVFMEEYGSHYELQFWNGASTPASATPLVVAGPTDLECSPMMKPIAIQGWFDPIAITNTTAEPVSGQPVHLQTMLLDEWGDPITDARVALQSSTDQLTWGPESVAVTLTADGSYESTIVAGEPGVCTYFRFAVLADEFHQGTLSPAQPINPHRARYLFTQTSDAGPEGWNPLVGMSTGIRARLQDTTGAPLVGRQVHLLSSADGKHFAESGVPVAEQGAGYYEADFSVASRVWCKLAWSSPDGTVYSAVAMVEPRSASRAYFGSAGIGVAGSASKAVAPRTAVVVTGDLRTHASSTTPGSVYVQATSDGLTWSNMAVGQMANVIPTVPQVPGAGTIWTTFVGASANTKLRLAWVARDWSDATVSTPLTYQTWVFARMPSMSSRQRANRSFVATGYSSSQTGVKLFIQRKSGRVYKPYVSYTVKHPANKPGDWAYRATMKLKAGTYRVYTVALADATHVQSPPSSAWGFVCK